MSMKTYTRVFCPHCNNMVEYSVQRGTSKYVNIGQPINVCPHCGKPFKRDNINEWLFLNQKDRDEYLKFGEKGSDRAGMYAMSALSLIVLIVAIATSINGNYVGWILFGIFGGLTLLLYIIPHIVKSNSNKERLYNEIIKDSFDRCCDQNYLKMLKVAGFNINKIQNEELKRNNVKEKYDAILEVWNSIDINGDNIEEQKTSTFSKP